MMKAFSLCGLFAEAARQTALLSGLPEASELMNTLAWLGALRPACRLADRWLDGITDADRP